MNAIQVGFQADSYCPHGAMQISCSAILA